MGFHPIRKRDDYFHLDWSDSGRENDRQDNNHRRGLVQNADILVSDDHLQSIDGTHLLSLPQTQWIRNNKKITSCTHIRWIERRPWDVSLLICGSR